MRLIYSGNILSTGKGGGITLVSDTESEAGIYPFTYEFCFIL